MLRVRTSYSALVIISRKTDENLGSTLLKCIERVRAFVSDEFAYFHNVDLENSVEYPENWDEMNEDEEFKKCLVDRDEECEEFDVISEQFYLTMPNSEIIKIYRIQNKALWKKYRASCEAMKAYNEGILNEKLLFHGTRETPPEKIYRGDTGFDARYSRNGMWGFGSYFAQNSKYSDSYAYRNGEMKEMFGAHVLTGVSSDKVDKSRKMPPQRSNDRDKTKVCRRYDSVTGYTGGTRVFITYDHIHAYPSYLIVYV